MCIFPSDRAMKLTFLQKSWPFDQIAVYLPVTFVLFIGAKPVSGPKCMIPYMVSYMYTTDPKRA